MALKEDLVGLVGAEHVSDDPKVLGRYASDYSFVQPRMPSHVVRGGSTEEVQAIVKYANERRIPVVPRSSGISFYGAGVPNQGGIILDMTRMNKILEVDGRNKSVKVEPGVTWKQLQTALAKQGMLVYPPLLPHASKSVLTTHLEREPIMVTKNEYTEVLMTMEMVLASGDIFFTGMAIARGMKNQLFHDGLIPGTRLFCGAQGTLGIATWATLKAEWLPSKDKALFIACDTVSDIAEPVYRIQRKMLGNECLVLNRYNLAAMLAEEFPADFKALRETLPPFTIVQVLSGMHRYPDERIAYEEKAVMETAAELHIEAQRTVGGIGGLDNTLLGMLRKPWHGKEYWRFRPKGASQDIFFHAKMERLPEFTAAISSIAGDYGYSPDEIGMYFQPVERGRICYYRYGFHYDPRDANETEKVRKLFMEASERVGNMGGLFTTPYGAWANITYRRAATYTSTLKVVKNALDPNNILNPGKLCY